jgi:hypothetical protein
LTGSISLRIAAAEAKAASQSVAQARPAPTRAAPAPLEPPAGNAAPPAAPPKVASAPTRAAQAPLEPPAGNAAPPAAPPKVASAPQSAALPAPTTSRVGKTEYGIDIGSAVSIEVLRARWLGIRSAHAELFEGLTPTAVLREIPQSKRLELRLVVGPFGSSEAAADLCMKLAPYRLFCKPTAFDRHRVALQ